MASLKAPLKVSLKAPGPKKVFFSSTEKQLCCSDLIPKGMPMISFLPGIEDEVHSPKLLRVLYDIHSYERNQIIAFYEKRDENLKKESSQMTTRSSSASKRKRENDAEEEETEEDDIPDDVSTYADAMFSSYECRTKLKKLEKKLSSESAARDFIQTCAEDMEFYYPN
jgi:hypothetical protein